MPDARSRLAFALDYSSLQDAERGARAVRGHVGVLKVGLELFTMSGPVAVEMARDNAERVFLDLKLHDIEKTVERTVAVACGLGVSYLTIHTSGGPAMMEAAAKRADLEGTGLELLGVTVLTSLDQADLEAVGVSRSPAEQARHLARLARDCGMGGLVCSAAEVAQLRAEIGPDLLLVTPGIRPSGAASGDQKRIATPDFSIRSGADLLVVGRPIRDAQDPGEAAANIVAEVQGALA